MAPYDSDSSGGEEEDYTETNVLLGYASPTPMARRSANSGEPNPSKPPSAVLAKCKVCKDIMVLLLQLNAELPDRFPGHERRLYVLACKRKSCRRNEGSIRAIRGTRVSETTALAAAKETQPKETPAPKAASAGLGEALFGVKSSSSSGAAPRANPFASSTPSANPFAPKSSATAPSNPFTTPKPAPEETNPSSTESALSTLPQTFAQTLSLNNPQSTTTDPSPAREPWPSTLPAPYPTRWLADADYETLDPITLPNIPIGPTQMEFDSGEGASGGGSGKEDKEVFESSHDATFQKFADRVGQNPEQCIRYEFSGQPLLYSKNDAVGKALHGSESKVGAVLPRCGGCGGQRVFEVQLTPQAIQELESEEEGMEGMDWGTVIVCVCERDCLERGVGTGEAGYVEEWVGVQWEELLVKR